MAIPDKSIFGYLTADGKWKQRTKADLDIAAVGAAPAAHAASHENTGSDEISVAGLSGELADDQPPKAHASYGGSHTPTHKTDATAAPTVNDDVTGGYGIGSMWFDVTNDKAYTCVDATDGAAVWLDMSGGAHDLGGATHNADTLANLNSKVSDATLDDSGDPRDPNAHAPGHTDGTDQIADEYPGAAGKTVTARGTAQVDTAQQKFGTGSALLDGNSDYLEVDDHADFAFAGDFTIELWARFAARPAGGAKFTLYNQLVDGSHFLDFRVYESATKFYVRAWLWDGSEKFDFSGEISLAADTWYHFALVRDGSAFTAYQDGVSKGTDTTAAAMPDLAHSVFLGCNAAGPGDYFNGWFDEIRVSSVARYTAPFTPSAVPFVPDANTVLLLHCDGADESTTFTDAAATGYAGLLSHNAQGISGVKTFDDFPVGPSAAPTADYELGNKKYVDDNVGWTTSPSKFHVTKADQNVNSATWTKLTWDSEDFDEGGDFDLPNDKYIAPANGFYHFDAKVWLEAIADAKDVYIALYVGGVIYSNTHYSTGLVTSPVILVSDIVQLSAADEVEVYVYHTHGALRIAAGDNAGSTFGGHRI